MVLQNGRAQNAPVKKELSRFSMDSIATEIARNYDRQEETNHIAKDFRAVRPCGVITIGGSGSEVGRRLYRQLDDQNTYKFVKYAQVDTDFTAFNADCTHVEAAQVSTNERVGNLLENPDMHTKIVDRFELYDSTNRAFTHSLLNSGLDQAGQVRQFGCMALLCDFSLVRSTIKRMVDSLNGSLVRLEKELEAKHQVRIRNKMKFYVVFSNAGGTGSSMALEIMAIIRSLTQHLDVEIAPFMIMPSTFDGVLDGRPEQQIRTRANGYAFMKEYNAIVNGFAQKHDITLGPDERNELEVDAGICNQLFTVGRYMADGRDLGSTEAVYCATANYIAAEIGTSIADQIEMDDSNQSTLKGLTADPVTGKPRNISTIGATALSLDVLRVSQFCGVMSSMDFLKILVNGPKPNPAEVERSVKGWMGKPMEQDELTLGADSLTASLISLVRPNFANRAKSLFKGRVGNRVLHFATNEFLGRFAKLKRFVVSDLKDQIQLQLNEFGNDMIAGLSKSLNKKMQQLVAERGFVFQQQFLRLLRTCLSGFQERLRTRRTSGEASFQNQTDKISALEKKLASKWFNSFRKQKKSQSRLVDEVEVLFETCLTFAAVCEASRILDAFQVEVDKLVQDSEKTLGLTRKRYDTCRTKLEELKSGRRLTTESLAELDVSTVKTDLKLYQRFHPNIAEVVETEKRKNESSAATISRLVADDTDFELLTKEFQKRFHDQLNDVSVVDVIADQIDDEQSNASIQAKIRQVVVGCQPLWQAESSCNSVEFFDSMIMGIPKSMSGSDEDSDSDAKRDLVVSSLLDSAKNRINPNGQYRGNAKAIVTGDIHKIYISRRTHGGALHYLREVKDCKAAYKEWEATGGHSVHIFGDKLVAKMPDIFPQPKLDMAQLAGAIALVNGWIAQRGPHWYWNLEKQPEGDYVCPLESHWGKSNQLVEEHSPIAELIDANLLCYQHGNAMDPDQKLGESLREAMAEFKNDEVLTGNVIELFNEMRAICGDHQIAQYLEQSIDELRRHSKSTSGDAGVLQRMADTMAQFVAETIGL